MIKLRLIEPYDLDLLYSIENDTSLWEVSNTNMPYSKRILEDYIMSCTGDIYTDKQLRLIIEHTAEDDAQPTAVGIIDLFDYSPRHNRAEVGIVVTREFRQQGYASEAMSQLKEYCKNILHIHQLYAIVDADNEASVKLFLKNGFIGENILKDWLYDGEKYKKSMFLQFFL